MRLLRSTDLNSKMVLGALWIWILSQGMVQAQTLLNGSFETNGGSCMYNIPNATFNANMPNCTGFGVASQLDIIRSTCGFGWAQDGAWFVAMAVDISNTQNDAFSMTLSAPVVMGNPYSLTWYDRGWTPYATNVLQVGLSTTSATFGSLLFTTPLPTMDTWVARSVNFNAPNAGQYVTARVVVGAYGWTHVDNFILSTVMPADEHFLTGEPKEEGHDHLQYHIDGLHEGASADLEFLDANGNGQVIQPLQATGEGHVDLEILRAEPRPHRYRIRLSDSEGQHHYGHVLTISDPEADRQDDWTAYPNPATTRISVSFEKPIGTVFLFDAMGKVIWQGEAQDQLEIDCTHFPRGSYFLLWSDEKERKVKVISVQ